MSSGKWQPFCLGLYVLIYLWITQVMKQHLNRCGRIFLRIYLPFVKDKNILEISYKIEIQQFIPQGGMTHWCLDSAGICVLTHLPLDKMAAILQTSFSNAFPIFHEWNFFIWIRISLNFVRKGPINNIPALV